jgi:inosine-uridine nucleoside N-ribohydrolase
VTFGDDDLARLEAAPGPVAAYLAEVVGRWRSRLAEANPGQEFMPHLYDPVAVASLVDDSFLTWRRGTVRVATGGDGPGRTTLAEDQAGIHRACVDVDRDAAMTFVLDRLCR